jgi:hypothetical protein
MTKQNLKTIQELITFYTDQMKETYDTMYDFYRDNEDLIVLERNVGHELYISEYKDMKTPERVTEWFFKVPIETYDDMIVFFDCLNNSKLLYHPEDSPYTVMSEKGRLFTNEECEYLIKRIEEVYDVCDNPCKYILDNLYN